LKAESQVPVPVYYKGKIVGEYVADLVVEDSVILSLVNFKGKKAVIRRMVHPSSSR